jgi:hypothetical protein
MGFTFFPSLVLLSYANSGGYEKQNQLAMMTIANL